MSRLPYHLIGINAHEFFKVYFLVACLVIIIRGAVKDVVFFDEGIENVFHQTFFLFVELRLEERNHVGYFGIFQVCQVYVDCLL